MRYEGKRRVRDEMCPEKLRIRLFTEIGNTEESGLEGKNKS